MIRSLRTGVSGLKSNQVKMDVVGDNIANVNTVGFKRSRAAFNEVLGQQLLGVGRTAGGTGINPSFVGLGTTVGSIDKNWSQGALDNTGVATDLALNGDGFFIAKAGDRNLLTRAGNFTFNRNGQLVTSNGLRVQGWAFDTNGDLITGQLSDIQINLNAQAPARQTTNTFINGNLSSEAPVGQRTSISSVIYDGQGEAHAIVVEFTRTAEAGTNGATEDAWAYVVQDENGNPISNVDASGTPTPLPAASRFGTPLLTDWTTGAGNSTPTPGGIYTGPNRTYTFEVVSRTDGGNGTADALGGGDDTVTIRWADSDGGGGILPINTSTGATYTNVPVGTDGLEVTFSAGQLTTGDTFQIDTFEPNNVGGFIHFDESGNIIPNNVNGAGEETFPFNWDLDGNGDPSSMTLNFGAPNAGAVTQYGGSTTATFRDQDGWASGSLVGYSIDPEGVVQLNFTNGEQQKIFQLAIGSVNNPQGLEQQGENFYITTSASGSLQLGQAGRDLRTAVVAGTLEMSNVDLATEFTDMIVAQRGYQAAARIITTADEILQETVQLKR